MKSTTKSKEKLSATKVISQNSSSIIKSLRKTTAIFGVLATIVVDKDYESKTSNI